MTYFSERRADRITAAEQQRADAMAAHQRRLDTLAAQADQRRTDQAIALRQRREQAEFRAARRAALVGRVGGWVRGNTEHALFGVIIIVPAVLAWSAMAAYGLGVFGPVGVLLPAFSEASMWVFAAATTRAVRQERPVWALRVGTWLSAAVAASLNYLHGAQAGPRVGAVMAIVSVGGLVVHQLVTAGPRRKRPGRFERQAARRAVAMRRAVLATAVGEVDQDGAVRLVFTPGRITLQRAGITRRWRVVPAPAPVVPTSTTTSAVVSVDSWVDEIDAQAALWAREPQGPARTHDTGTTHTLGGEPVGSVGPELAAWINQARAHITAGNLSARPSKREVARVMRVRAATAGRIARALKDHPDDPGAGHLART